MSCADEIDVCVCHVMHVYVYVHVYVHVSLVYSLQSPLRCVAMRHSAVSHHHVVSLRGGCAMRVWMWMRREASNMYDHVDIHTTKTHTRAHAHTHAPTRICIRIHQSINTSIRIVSTCNMRIASWIHALPHRSLIHAHIHIMQTLVHPSHIHPCIASIHTHAHTPTPPHTPTHVLPPV